MKFEVKTQKDDLTNPFIYFFSIFSIIFLIIILSNISVKFGNMSRFHEINYICKLITIDQSSSNFKKLSKLTSQTSKQKMWDLCREIVK